MRSAGAPFAPLAVVRYARLSLLVFLILQASDGLITYGAVSVFGIQAEGNPLVASWMLIAGPGAALFGAKLWNGLKACADMRCARRWRTSGSA